jgi:hypothetical protein
MISTKALCFPLIVSALLLTGCGRITLPQNTDAAPDSSPTTGPGRDEARGDGSSIFDLFDRSDNETRVSVNKYIWNASLEVLDFLPVQSVDPFTGVIVTGYGTPPGGGGSYRATVLIDDPALDARSLNVALQGAGGRPVSAATSRAIEDAILSRARQLRIADNRL